MPPVKLSLSLGDERVILAHRTPVRFAEHPLLQHLDGRAPIHVVLPAYKATRTIPDVVAEMPVGGGRPRAADRRRVPRRDDDGRARARPRRAPPPCQPRLRRQPEDRLHAGAARRRRRDRDGPRRQPVRPGPRGRHGGADPRRRRGRRDRLAAARRPRDRGRDAALEVGRQPAADRDREPGVRRALLRVPHGLPGVLAPTSCARSRSCATPTTSCSTRRSSPRSSRARRAWWRSRSRRATSTRRPASTSRPASATP